MLNRTLAPESKQVEQINFISPLKQQLDNGIPVFTINAGQQELVRIEFIFENVNWDQSKPLQAVVVSHLINNGTAELSAMEIAARVDYFGAFLQTEYGADQSSVKVYTLNKHLAAVLPIIRSILNDSIFPKQELDIFIQNQKQSLQVSLQKNDFLARKHFAHALFGDSSYGSNIDASDYDLLNQADLLDYFKAAYQPENCTIIVAGKFEQKEFDVLNDILGKPWSNHELSLTNKFEFTATEGTEILIERPDAIQSAIRMGTLAINRSHEDFPGFQVMNCLLGGYFGSRLMANIREDKGYTYGIGSAAVSLKDAGYFFIATEVGADVCQSALQEIEKEIQLLKTETVEEPELDLVRNYMLGAMLGSLENAFSHADKFKNTYFSGLDHKYYERYIHTVKTITADDIKRLANTYLNTDGFTKVIAGKK
ncbi:putative zinc protease [Pedobacter sp. BAL39]|uniref:M16 family metallopeptidase n=1 Tax=Pedobacter sp. BAL39 TaxID=391596 RepID=UPI000155A01E|nr:pitrilysin family protein [Pedobacter sp. BAL39]EDM36586.1 putative zinc protease [Pedobacter sp. BAL39]